ncbi:7938_t:CDS:2 [Funneliformis mosseae]|uniref:7938_t:CDS:1 n=1 Tax=Funneliformis mosseae TaxID=27381 RepID=A0A9N9CC85_FUNMO|nr:7938_t:CDS:2 [Funneliformis mosseae]
MIGVRSRGTTFQANLANLSKYSHEDPSHYICQNRDTIRRPLPM